MSKEYSPLKPLITCLAIVASTACANGQFISIKIPEPYTFEDVQTIVKLNSIAPDYPELNSLLTGDLPHSKQQNQSTNNPSAWMIQKYLISPEEDIKKYQQQSQKSNDVLDEIYTTIDEQRIYYDFPWANGQIHKRFESAFQELSQMLTGERSIELTRMQYLVEGSYDHRLSYEFLKSQVMDMAFVCQQYMKKEGMPMSDNLAKIMAIFHVMSDTTTTRFPGLENEFTTYPMLYDFDDPWGRDDYSKTFVAKLISTGTGNCSSLPRLFLMIAEQMGAAVSLSFAPEHSYVKFQDHFGEWHNIELTNQIFTTDDHIMEWGWVKSEAVKSGIYMAPISKKELIAHGISELAMTHYKIFGNTPYIEKCTDLTLQYYPNSITAHMIKANYYTELMRYITEQYQSKGRSLAELQKDPKAMAIYAKLTSLYQTIDDLGYAQVPEELYNRWIKSMNNEANKQESRNKMREMLNSVDR